MENQCRDTLKKAQHSPAMCVLLCFLIFTGLLTASIVCSIPWLEQRIYLYDSSAQQTMQQLFSAGLWLLLALAGLSGGMMVWCLWKRKVPQALLMLALAGILLAAHAEGPSLRQATSYTLIQPTVVAKHEERDSITVRRKNTGHLIELTVTKAEFQLIQEKEYGSIVYTGNEDTGILHFIYD